MICSPITESYYYSTIHPRILHQINDADGELRNII